MNKEPLMRVKCFLLDMDGTFNLGDKLIEGSLRFIDTLNELGIDYLFLTNNSSKDRRLYAEKITRLGLPIPEEKVFTSGEATALYLGKEHPSSSVYLVGTPALEEEFRQHGFQLARPHVFRHLVREQASQSEPSHGRRQRRIVGRGDHARLEMDVVCLALFHELPLRSGSHTAGRNNGVGMQIIRRTWSAMFGQITWSGADDTPNLPYADGLHR